MDQLYDDDSRNQCSGTWISCMMMTTHVTSALGHGSVLISCMMSEQERVTDAMAPGKTKSQHELTFVERRMLLDALHEIGQYKSS